MSLNSSAYRILTEELRFRQLSNTVFVAETERNHPFHMQTGLSGNNFFSFLPHRIITDESEFPGLGPQAFGMKKLTRSRPIALIENFDRMVA
jgi:hypothetical protein